MKSAVRVHISVAMTIDGYIDDRSGERLVLSNDADMQRVRGARAACDAVLVGANTVRRDNPSLRAPEGMATPARVTITRSGDLDPNARFFDGSTRTIVLASADAAAKLRGIPNAEIYVLDAFEPEPVLAAVRELGIRTLFVEGGTKVLTAFVAAGAFDRLQLAVAPFFAGEAGGARIVDPAKFLDGPQHRLVLLRAWALGDMAILEYERSPK